MSDSPFDKCDNMMIFNLPDLSVCGYADLYF